MHTLSLSRAATIVLIIDVVLEDWPGELGVGNIEVDTLVLCVLVSRTHLWVDQIVELAAQSRFFWLSQHPIWQWSIVDFCFRVPQKRITTIFAL